MFQIKHLTLTHKKDNRVILKDFSLTIRPGNRIVLIGEEGNGKSTLLKWMVDPCLIEDYMDHDGERIQTEEHLAYLPQEMPQQELSLSVTEFLFPGDTSSADTALHGTYARLSAQLGIRTELIYADRHLETLSGGEKIKIQMMRLLAKEPTILLLDEPSNDIDIETLAWMERLLLHFDGAVIYVSHDETLIEATANRVVHIEQLKRKTAPKATVANIPYTQYAAERIASFERQTQIARSERREEKKQMERFRRIEQSVEHAQNNVSRQDPATGRLLKKKMKAVKSMEHRYEREHAQMTVVPEQEEAMVFRFGEEVRLPAGKTVLDLAIPTLRVTHGQERILAKDIALLIRGPEKVCIIGANGAGKTTLLRRIAHEMRQRDDLRAVYMPQQYEEEMNLNMTPLSFLSATGDKEEITRIRTYLGSMKYTAEEMLHPVRDLSGGQRVKLMLLKISMSGADVLLLDEPTRNLSPLSGPVIREVFASFGGAIIAVSHDRKFLRDVCDTVYLLTKDGLTPVGKSSV